MDEEHLSSLERARRRLYSTEDIDSRDIDSLSEAPAYENAGWEKLKVEQLQKEPAGEHLPGPTRFLIAAAVFFVITLAGTGAYIYFGGRSVSTSNVAVKIEGPTSIASGDTVPLVVSIDNRNPTTLHDVTITVVYPEGTRDPSDPSKPLPSIVENIGDVPSGGHQEKTLRASVYGSEGAQIGLPVKIQYKVDGSTASFVINKQYDFAVTSSPIALTVSTLSQISSGQTATVKVVVKNNATTNLDNAAVVAQYPFGFTLTGTDPKANNGLFYLGTLQSGEERTITITGIISGENNDERIFKFVGGVASSDAATTLTTAYSNKEVSVQVTKPFLAATISVAGDSSDSPVITPGISTQALVNWVNNLPTAITNAQITVHLAGDALDPASVHSGTGFYRSSDSTVIFNSQTSPSLASLAAGSAGQGGFTFATKKAAALANLRSPVITMTVSVSGQRTGDSNVPETVTSTLTRTVRVGTSLSLASRAVRTIGPISNTGPWPPAVNQETTYTVQFTLASNFNSVAGAKVTATLPTYVRFTGKTAPADGSLTYDEATRTVTWDAGNVDAGSAAKTMSFQVGLTPSVSQSGFSAVLVNKQSVSGTDRFTQKQIQGTVGEITTEITADPAYTGSQGRVQ